MTMDRKTFSKRVLCEPASSGHGFSMENLFMQHSIVSSMFVLVGNTFFE